MKIDSDLNNKSMNIQTVIFIPTPTKFHKTLYTERQLFSWKAAHEEIGAVMGKTRAQESSYYLIFKH